MRTIDCYEITDEIIDLFTDDILTKREKEVIYLYYYEYMTEKEVAEELGISQQRVNRLKNKALKKLRKNADC